MSKRAYVIIVAVMLCALAFSIYADKTDLFPVKMSPGEESYWDGYEDGYSDGIVVSEKKASYVESKLKHLLEVLYSTDMYDGDIPFEEVIDAVTDDIYDVLSELEKDG